MRSLYFDCETGISGDMTVAALLDLGADEKKLMASLESIGSDEFSIKISRVTKAGLDCCDFDVVLADDNHDHDMEYLYGHTADGAHHHDHTEEHHHEHHSNEAHHHDHHEHRNLKDIYSIIDKVSATESAKALAKKIFHILAEAEAKAHATTVEEVHFHEVGAIDSIVDILSCAICFDDLNISEVIVPKICDGQGSVRCQHGIIPVPVPAVLNIASMYGLPLTVTNRQGEYITPTGAAFLAAVKTGTSLPPAFIPLKIGMGAGKREHEQPGILRAILFEGE